jgi:hypothetical protein
LGNENGSLEMNSFDLKEFINTIKMGEMNRMVRKERIMIKP